MRTGFVFLTLALIAASWCTADPGAIFKPGSVHEQHLKLPAENTDLSEIFKRLSASDPEVKEAALQWLLRRENAQDLGYFHRESIRFSVETVNEVKGPDGTWRLIECAYLSRTADISGHTEYRARWPVAYVVDPQGHLRDWVHDYDVAILRNLNGDKDLELVAYLDSPKQVIVYSYQRGRSRELLRVDDVPEHGRLLKSYPAPQGGEYQEYEGPVEIVIQQTGPQQLKIANHGIFSWDTRSQRYIAPTTRPAKLSS